MNAVMQRLATWQTFSIRLWFANLVDRTVANIVSRALKSHLVQEVIVGSVTCYTPIGAALNHQINVLAEEATREIDCGDINGLGREIEENISTYFRDNTIDANDIEDLDKEVTPMIEEAIERCEITARQVSGLTDTIGGIIDEFAGDPDTPFARMVAQRMSY